VYEALGNFFQLAVGSGYLMSFDFDVARFCGAYGFNINQTLSSLKILEKAGYIEFQEDMEMQSRIHFIMVRDDLYKFQVANEAFDAFIKLLLRSYTGLFSDYVNISESQLASRANTTNEVVYEYLKRLNHLKVIKYIPKRKGPQVVYLQSRLDIPEVVLGKQVYELRKDHFENRIHSVIDYSTKKHLCRSTILLRYFGQDNGTDCGICDVCAEKKKSGVTTARFEELSNQIRAILKEGPLSLEMMLDRMDHDKDLALKVIRWLEDNGLLVVEDDNYYAVENF
jgi:ATP-dependent DNA helicase RecQ